MQKAKENVEKHYAVVGVLEELNKTLTVLEHYVPRFFKGALDTYWSKTKKCLNKNAIFTLFFLSFCRRSASIFQDQSEHLQAFCGRSNERNCEKKFHPGN